MLKDFFRRNKVSPLSYTHTTHKGLKSYKIYVDTNLTKKETLHNKTTSPPIITVFHLKKMFMRFLKKNDMLSTYIYYMRRNTLEIPRLDDIIEYNYYHPFAYHIDTCQRLLQYAYDNNNDKARIQLVSDLRKMYDLNKGWEKLMDSINLSCVKPNGF